MSSEHTSPETVQETVAATGVRRVPAATIRTKLDGLDGPVTTEQIVDHLVANAATDDEIATVASLPDREWDDYNDALAYVGSGFEPDHR